MEPAHAHGEIKGSLLEEPSSHVRQVGTSSKFIEKGISIHKNKAAKVKRKGTRRKARSLLGFSSSFLY
jgi:hypothetical protein